ncbi:MAG: pyrrolidone-carboxylate peptidase [Arachnia propionica]|nr:MAG: pyrrolidone-carboxylate peptidase [Arachnia propionica]
MRILVTGFEPFGGDAENATMAVVQALAARRWPTGLQVATEVLPVAFEAGPAALRAAAARERPDAAVCLGEAGGRNLVTPERWAKNLADARIADNDGLAPSGKELDDGVEALAATLDVDEVVAAITAAGVPAAASSDAGAFVCNAVYRAALRDLTCPAIFIHVPALRSQGVATVGAETDDADSQSGATDIAPLTAADLVRAVTAVLLHLAQ